MGMPLVPLNRLLFPPSVLCQGEAQRGRTPQHYFHVSGVAPGLRGSQVGPEAGPSPGVLVLSGQQLGWAAVAAPPGKAHTR